MTARTNSAISREHRELLAASKSAEKIIRFMAPDSPVLPKLQAAIAACEKREKQVR